MSQAYENRSIGHVGSASQTPAAHRCHVAIILEDGVYSARVLNLPGVGSFGDSEEEAFANVREAIAGTIESFQDDQQPIPWRDPSEYTVPKGAASTRWILVDA